jgi:hypothetical protein
MCANPLVWWKTHEGQFSNVGFLVKHVFGILGFQIEIEIVLSLIRVLRTLKRCYLQVQNLDKIITIINNWLDDPCQNFTPYANLKDYLKVEVILVEKNYELIKEVEFFEELQVDED